MTTGNSNAPPPISPTPEERQEIGAIMRHFGADSIKPVYDLIDGQFAVIHARAQALLQLAGVIITVTGFSGRIIADTNGYAQGMIIAGVALVSLGAATAMLFVMPIRWITSYLDESPQQWLLIALRRRRRKSRGFLAATILFVVGMLLYLAAIAIMLAFPEATELTRVR